MGKHLEIFRREDGKLYHAGDCFIYGINGLCTCGLLHIITRNPDSEDCKQHEEEINKHMYNKHWINNAEVPKPNPVSDEELQKILIDAGWKL